MTIEIHQLIIRAVVDEGAASAHAAPTTEAPPAALPAGTATGTPGPQEDRQALLASCVREVMRRLERARER
jgi:hypothetical protein